MNEIRIELRDAEATVKLGIHIGQLLSAGGVIFLCGTLGAGKTTLTRGILSAFGHSGAVKSPTYTLVEPYELTGAHVYHFDLYRLGEPEELEYMGIRDYFSVENICVVEWPERGVGYLPEPDMTVAIQVVGSERCAEIQAHNTKTVALLTQLKKL